MNPTARRFLILGALNGMLAVVAGAFGAHALENRLESSLLQVYETGADYHFYHALALIAVGLAALRVPTRLMTASGWSFLGGIVIFSGSLYALALSGIRTIGAVTPIGGVLFIIGWALLAMAVYRNKP